MSALEIQRARAFAIADELVARSPQGAIACIFAGGSLARGEVWCADIGGELEVYSDVDLYVVVSDAMFTAVRASAAAIAATTPDVDGVRFLRPADVGVYTRADLVAQPARPGTIDLSENHVLLHGDPSVPERLAPLDPSRMAPDEALYLLENRVAELAAVDADAQGSGGRLVLIQTLKARLDVHAACAIIDGSFVPTLTARARLFTATPPPGLDAAGRADIADAYRAAVNPGAWFAGTDADAERERAMRALTGAWRLLANDVLKPRHDGQVEEMVSLRCRGGARIDNARELARLCRRAGLPVWRGLAMAPWLSRLSPRAALRLDPLVRQLHARGGYDARHYAAHQHYVDMATRAFGFTAGSQEMRVRSMHRVIS